MRAEILFPEVCNLYGDLQNVYYLRRCCQMCIRDRAPPRRGSTWRAPA